MKIWTGYQRHAKRLNHFPKSCFRKLMKIKMQDRIPDIEVLKRAGMQCVYTLLKSVEFRWTGHVTRMADERFPKKIFCGELQLGRCSHGGQKKRYKDTLKASLRYAWLLTESRLFGSVVRVLDFYPDRPGSNPTTGGIFFSYASFLCYDSHVVRWGLV